MSQSRYQRGIEKEVDDHLRAVDGELQRRLRGRHVAGLLLGGPKETVGAPREPRCTPTSAAACAVGSTSTCGTRAPTRCSARPPRCSTASARSATRTCAGAVEEGLGTGGRAAAGLPDVLRAVHERRIEVLVVQDGFAAMGTRCPRCGWLGVSAGAQCPADGTMTEPVDNVVESAVAGTFAQDGRVRYLPVDDTELEQRGSIAALLRF